MCGRFVRSFTVEDLIQEINEVVPAATVISRIDPDLCDANFNVAPTTLIPVVFVETTNLVIDVMQWGFQPPKTSNNVSKPLPSLVINARSETVHEKPMFRGLLAEHRCIVPMNGFYEWKRNDASRGKVPFFVTRHDHNRMWVAGIWRDKPNNSTAEHLSQVALLTADANEDIAYIHDRTPCQLRVNDALHWICDDVAPLSLIEKWNHPRLQARHVSKDVNSIRNNRPNLIDAIDENIGNEQLGLFE